MFIPLETTSSLFGDQVTSSWLTMYITTIPSSFFTGATSTEHKKGLPKRTEIQRFETCVSKQHVIELETKHLPQRCIPET